MTLRLLSIDTTANFGSLALLDDTGFCSEVLLESPDGFGHILYGHLDRLLRRNGWSLGDIDCFAAAAGPGSFTGVRIGLAAVKGLAEATGKPVAAVSNLQAIAALGTAPLRATLLDARRGEVYGALYDAALRLVRPEVVTKFPAWIESLPEGEIEFLSTSILPFRDALAGTRFAAAPLRDVPRALAPAIARIALARYQRGAVSEAAVIDANYVRRSDAELFWKE